MALKVLMLGPMPHPYAPGVTGGDKEVVIHLVRRLVERDDVELSVFGVNTYALPDEPVKEVLDGFTLYRSQDLSPVDGAGAFTKLRLYLGRFGLGYLLRLPRFLMPSIGGVDGYVRSTPVYHCIREVIREVRPDVMHVHHIHYLPLTSHLASDGRVPVVTTIHSFHALMEMTGRERGRRLELISRDFETSTRLLAVSGHIQQQAIELGAEPGKVSTVYNGVDLSFWKEVPMDEARQRLGISRTGRNVLFVGNLIPRKGADLLIEAFSRVVREVGDAHLVIVGQGEERDNLVRQATDLGIIDAVTFTGRVEFEDLLYWYGACDVFCAPSREEAFGIVYVEAMACGRPPVGPDTGGPAEIITHGETGMLFRTGDPDDLATKLADLLKDDEMRRAMGERCRRVVLDQYSWDSVVERIMGIYRDAAEPGR